MSSDTYTTYVCVKVCTIDAKDKKEKDLEELLLRNLSSLCTNTFIFFQNYIGPI